MYLNEPISATVHIVEQFFVVVELVIELGRRIVAEIIAEWHEQNIGAVKTGLLPVLI